MLSIKRDPVVWNALWLVVGAGLALLSLTAVPTRAAARNATQALHPTSAAVGNSYYVSASSGNDDWPGTIVQPWRTLAKVSSMTFQSYDQILLMRGDVWEGEELILHGNGDFIDDSWITLGAYGEGSKPRITNPPYDETIDLEESWSAINAVYPDQYRKFMKIAVHVDGSGWFISGLEIDNAEMGIFVSGNGARYWMEDLYFHDILGLFAPMPPNWEASCQTTCELWNPYPSPTWGSAIQFANAEYVTVRDVAVERATGGINGFSQVTLMENVFLDRVTNGGLDFAGSNVTIRYATVLNAQWPNGLWYGADPVMLVGGSGWVMERSEVAYTNNYDHIPGVNPGIQDASPLDFDLESINSIVRDNFFHDNIGSCVEFNMGGGSNRNIIVANNVCYNNGLEDDPRFGIEYLKVAFAADACGFHQGQTYIIQDNAIYKAFPGQYLNYYFDTGQLSNYFSQGEQTCGHVVWNNTVYEYGEYTLPLPVPMPPPSQQVNIANAARIQISSGAETAAFAQDDSLETEWVSDEAQPWIYYEWDIPQTIDTIRLFDRPDLENWAVSGLLTFSDGSSINVTGGILNNGAMREVVFDSPKTVTWAQFAVMRNVLEHPGTNVGLTELQVYLAAAPQPSAPAPDPGTFTVDFSDLLDAPTELMGLYPGNVNGIDWVQAGWTTAIDPASGNRYVYIDSPLWGDGQPKARYTMFILAHGKVLQSVSARCPTGATVGVSQLGQPSVMFPCDDTLATHATGWSSEPIFSNIVNVWIDLSATTATLNDVWFDDFVYSD